MHARNHGVTGGRILAILLAGAAGGHALPAQADVMIATDNGFVSRNAVEVTVTPAVAWRTLVAPAGWWSDDHTFSGSARNLTIDPVADGCFCEKLPLKPDAPRGSSPGGVMHMRVVYADAGHALRMTGALGPLQSEAVNATLTITLKPTEKGTRILWEYVVGGFMRYEVPGIAASVDRVMAGQMASLAKVLGPAVLREGEPLVRAPEADAKPAQAVADGNDDATSAPDAPPAGGRKAGTRAAAALPVEETRAAPDTVPRSGRVWSLPPAPGMAGGGEVAARSDASTAVATAASTATPAPATPAPATRPAPVPARTANAPRPAARASKPAARPVLADAPVAAASDGANAGASASASDSPAAPRKDRAAVSGTTGSATAVKPARPGKAARPVRVSGAGADGDSAAAGNSLSAPASGTGSQALGGDTKPVRAPVVKQVPPPRPGSPAARKAEQARKAAQDKEREDANAAFDAALGGPH